MTPTFSIIAEGPSDFEVLRHVLAGFFSDPDIVVKQLQPAVDATSGSSSPGGWYEVLRFLGSEKFAGAFTDNDRDFVLVHIDTDVCEEPHFDVSRRELDGRERTVEELLVHTIARLVREIGPETYERFSSRILFAVAVESIECWLLPLFYNDNRREKIVNCFVSLNNALSAREGYSIDRDRKQVKYYRKIVKPLARRKALDLYGSHNPSFKAFLESLDEATSRPATAPTAPASTWHPSPAACPHERARLPGHRFAFAFQPPRRPAHRL